MRGITELPPCNNKTVNTPDCMHAAPLNTATHAFCCSIVQCCLRTRTALDWVGTRNQHRYLWSHQRMNFPQQHHRTFPDIVCDAEPHLRQQDLNKVLHPCRCHRDCGRNSNPQWWMAEYPDRLIRCVNCQRKIWREHAPIGCRCQAAGTREKASDLRGRFHPLSSERTGVRLMELDKRERRIQHARLENFTRNV